MYVYPILGLKRTRVCKRRDYIVYISHVKTVIYIYIWMHVQEPRHTRRKYSRSVNISFAWQIMNSDAEWVTRVRRGPLWNKFSARTLWVGEGGGIGMEGDVCALQYFNGSYIIFVINPWKIPVPVHIIWAYIFANNEPRGQFRQKTYTYYSIHGYRGTRRIAFVHRIN